MSMFAFSLPANAACIDLGNPTFANAQRKISLCVEGNCKDASLIRICGNASYEMQEYDAENTRWVFHVRVLQDGSAESEFAVLRDSEEISGSEAAKLNCMVKSETNNCAFVNRILLQSRED
ncbi:MAG: hypothetical protein AB3N07_13585 [Ruegeria sp.]|uniref:hypothetical protein n=1 Tax=Ruegeria sp. ANG-S4 TaxID=1577904 RepID=UPI00057C5D3D|nr:hypothetical protein [Ruegeria sp. ANG-S4]KIC46312.1 hypothetical protein RA28_00410 [Ruegeria sp. ANG-S4]